MKESMKTRLEAFDAANTLLQKKYVFHSSELVAAAASVFTRNGKTVDIDRLKECEAIVKKHFGIFSNIRGMMEIPLVAEMACREDPEAFLTEVGEIYSELKVGRFAASEFDVLCAVMLEGQTGDTPISELRESIQRIYKKMGKNHPLLTSHEDLPIAAMLALSGKEEDALLAEMETCYQILKPHFALRGEQLQTLCAILSMQDEKAETKCEKVLALCDALKEKGYSVNFQEVLPIVAGLCGIRKSAGELADEVCEAADWLKDKKGFGLFGMGKSGRISFGMLMTLEDESAAGDINAAYIGSTLTSIIMTEIILSLILATVIVTTINNSNSNS